MGDVEALGLLKMDFLGLRNLDVLDEAVRLVRESARRRPGRPLRAAAGRPEDLRHALAGRHARRLPVRVLGHARGAAPGQADPLRRPHRPGRAVPAGADGQHPAVRPAQERPRAGHLLRPRLEPILGSTMGVYIYQEQAMQIAKELAGFSPAEADDLRKAIGKKIRSLMDSLREKFLEGCAAQRRHEGRRRGVVGRERALRRLLVRQGPLGLLRPDRLPHRLPQGELPRPSTWRR